MTTDMERNELIAITKALIVGQEVTCPNCKKSVLVPLHPKRKRRQGDINYQCPSCEKVYRPAMMQKEVDKMGI